MSQKCLSVDNCVRRISPSHLILAGCWGYMYGLQLDCESSTSSTYLLSFLMPYYCFWFYETVFSITGNTVSPEMWALLQIYILMLKITCKFFLSVQQRKTLKHTLMYAIYIHKKIIGTWFTVNPINLLDDSFHFLSFIFVLIVSMFCSILLNLENMQINNAVSNAYSYKPLAEASDEDLM